MYLVGVVELLAELLESSYDAVVGGVTVLEHLVEVQREGVAYLEKKRGEWGRRGGVSVEKR